VVLGGEYRAGHRGGSSSRGSRGSIFTKEGGECSLFTFHISLFVN